MEVLVSSIIPNCILNFMVSNYQLFIKVNWLTLINFNHYISSLYWEKSLYWKKKFGCTPNKNENLFFTNIEISNYYQQLCCDWCTCCCKIICIKNLLLPLTIAFNISSKKDSSNIVTSVTVGYVSKERSCLGRTYL